MDFIVIVLVKLLDPISFAIVFGVSFFSRKKWIIAVAAIVGAVAVETILTSTQMARSWGQGLIIGLLVSGIHALLCYWLIGKFKKTNSV